MPNENSNQLQLIAQASPSVKTEVSEVRQPTSVGLNNDAKREPSVATGGQP